MERRQHFENLPQGEQKGRWDKAYMKMPDEMRKNVSVHKEWLDVSVKMPPRLYKKIKEYQEENEIATATESIRTLIKRGLMRDEQ